MRDLPANSLRELGVGVSRASRASSAKFRAPRFIDKLPNNFTQVGLIQLILPNARIVDVRRHPLACCVSNFKQHWATGQNFAYDLTDLGAYYRSYVELMAHFDAALPGRVHRVIYEDLVAHPEAETRRLLDACALPFEDACLRFYENERAVRTRQLGAGAPADIQRRIGQLASVRALACVRSRRLSGRCWMRIQPRRRCCRFS